MINGTIKKITEVKGGVMYLAHIDGEGYGRTYSGERYRNYDNWKDLRVGDRVGGLRWKDKEKNLIDADSPICPID